MAIFIERHWARNWDQNANRIERKNSEEDEDDRG